MRAFRSMEVSVAGQSAVVSSFEQLHSQSSNWLQIDPSAVGHGPLRLLNEAQGVS